MIGLKKMADRIWATTLFDDFKTNHSDLDMNSIMKMLGECLSDKLFSFIASLT